MVSGILSGVLYDMYRILRDRLRLRRMGTMLGDILFWLVFTCLFFFVLLWCNAGEVRIYVFLGLLVGIFVYMRWLRTCTCYWLTIFFRWLGKILFLIISIFRFILRIILAPFKFVILIVVFPFRWISRLFVLGGNGMKKVGGKCLHPLERIGKLFKRK